MSYKIMNYVGVEDDLRGIFGVDEYELPEKLIHRLTNLPAAERAVQAQLTLSLDTYTENNLMTAKLAVLYQAAANCLAAVKVNLLAKETDTKTGAERFSNALTMTEEDLLRKVDRFTLELQMLDTESLGYTPPALFTHVSPSIDVITGD